MARGVQLMKAGVTSQRLSAIPTPKTGLLQIGGDYCGHTISHRHFVASICLTCKSAAAYTFSAKSDALSINHDEL